MKSVTTHNNRKIKYLHWVHHWILKRDVEKGMNLVLRSSSSYQCFKPLSTWCFSTLIHSPQSQLLFILSQCVPFSSAFSLVFILPFIFSTDLEFLCTLNGPKISSLENCRQHLGTIFLLKFWDFRRRLSGKKFSTTYLLIFLSYFSLPIFDWGNSK